MKHTSGPWSIRLDKPSDKYRMALVVTTASSARAKAINCTCSGDSYAADCANARLIAAAPDLVAALERAIIELQAMSGWDKLTPTMIQARAALKRAKEGA